MPSNPYPGINAHMNSVFLLPDGGWESFHAEHIPRLRQALDAVLPEGYYAFTEKSLQVSEISPDDVSLRRKRPDVSVYQSGKRATSSPAIASAPTAVLPMSAQVTDDVPEYMAVRIYELKDGRAPGKLVTQLELLSPGNKPGHSNYSGYISKRRETLHGGVNLVELDYLHTTRPIIPEVPSYPAREDEAQPYYVLVTDPRPTVAEGSMALYAVPVDAPLPRIAVPLLGDDIAVLDLQAVYNQTVEDVRGFTLLVDYTQPPENVGAFSEDDQQRIQDMMDGFTI